ncbi:MAG: SRPBCC family protein [Gaiellaceae bacterium]
MAPIRESIEIARRPEEVFAYIDDLARHGEWQDGIVSSKVETDGPTRVGTRVAEVRRMGSREMAVPYEITEHDPPRAFAFRGTEGNVRVVGRGTVEPVGDGSTSRASIELDFVGHGLGKFLVPLARSQAGKQVQKDQRRLKEKLESGEV